MTDLKNKRIVVTGGASGIGASAVRAFAKAGAQVASLDVSETSGAAIAQAASAEAQSGGAAYFDRCDISIRADVDRAIDAAASRFSGLDALVHVAGVEQIAPAETIDDAQWQRTIDVNARGTMYTNQAAFRHLQAAGGAIVNFASDAGVQGLPGSAAYAASKGAVLGWTRTVAKEWARYKITVNAICPVMWTPMFERHRDILSPPDRERLDMLMALAVPLGGKPGNPDRDLAPYLCFLVSDGARFVTGQTLAIDGGGLIP